MRKSKFILVFVITCLIGNLISFITLLVPPPLQVYAYALVALPGTFFHECAHYFVALALGGAPYGFSLIPSADGTLGHVMIHPTWYNASPIGFAPMLLAPLAYLFIAVAASVRGIFKTVALSYFAACAWAACVPSMQDFRIAFGHVTSLPFGILFILCVGYATYRLANFLLKKGI